MVKALKKHRKDYKFVKLKNTRHNPFNTVENQEKAYGEVAEFLAKHLKTD